eukprot:12316189-Alexandrium_andersonii.AAC.1
MAQFKAAIQDAIKGAIQRTGSRGCPTGSESARKAVAGPLPLTCAFDCNLGCAFNCVLNCV